MKLGKSKFSGERKEVFKIKDGDNIYRILPPMGALADKGVYSRFFRVVWGYKDSKGNLRPFISPRVQNYNTKMIEVDCAAFNRVERLKAEYAETTKEVKALAAEGKAFPEELKKRLETLTDLVGRKGRYNIDSKHHLNAIDKEGKIGLLKLAGRGFNALKAVFKKLEAGGTDATGVENGRYMVINRTGTGLDTVYAVSEFKEQVNVEGHGLVEKSVPHNLTDSIIGRLEAEAYELDEIYPAPTEDQVRQLVEASERSEAEAGALVDKFFGERDAGPKNAAAATTNAAAEQKLEQRAEVAAETVAEPTPEPVVETKVAETVAEPIKEEVASTPAPETANPAAQSDEDFLASLNIELS